MVANDRVRLEDERCLTDTCAKRLTEGFDHPWRHVSIASGLIGHDVAHPTDGKRQVRRIEAHWEELSASRQVGAVGHVNAGNDRDLMAGGKHRADGFGKVYAAARAVGLLGGNAEDAHGGTFRCGTCGKARRRRANPVRLLAPLWRRGPHRRRRAHSSARN